MPEITIHHRGRKTVAIVQGSDEAQRNTFLTALLEADFVELSHRDQKQILHRKLRLFQDDWPMKIIIVDQGNQLEIIYFMFIPWSWIGLFSLMVLFLPFMASLPQMGLLLLISPLVIALAIYKQRMDLSPTAWWQGPSRKAWEARMKALLHDAFVTVPGSSYP